MESIGELAKSFNEYGPVAVLLAGLTVMNAFFIWRDYQREAQQSRQVEQLQKNHHDIVLPLLIQCKEAVSSCKEVINQNSQIIASCINNGRR